VADDTRLAKLGEGVRAWNSWRRENPEIRPDLSGSDLSGEQGTGPIEKDFNNINLSDTNLRNCELWCIDFTGADLRRANLQGADLADEDPAGASDLDLFPAANMNYAELREADLSGADLGDVSLIGARLNVAKLRRTILRRANLVDAHLAGADLTDADLGMGDVIVQHGAVLGRTILGEVDLRTVKGLADVYHRAPSILSTSTLAQSSGNLPASFLRECGLADWEIENAKLYAPALTPFEIAEIQTQVFTLRAAAPIQISSVFIGPLRHQIEKYNILDFSGWKDRRVFERQLNKLLAGLVLWYSSRVTPA
jgi:pentapeptide repeat protein